MFDDLHGCEPRWTGSFVNANINTRRKVRNFSDAFNVVSWALCSMVIASRVTDVVEMSISILSLMILEEKKSYFPIAMQ